MIEIRSVCIEDYESIYALWIAISGMGLNDIEDSYEGIEPYMKRNPHTSFVAVDNQKKCWCYSLCT